MLNPNFPREADPRQRVWTAMRILKRFSKGELIATADVPRKTVDRYVQALTRFGYVRQATTPTTGRAATYQLLSDLGPLAPDVGPQGRGPLLDPNLNKNHDEPVLPACRVNLTPIQAAAQQLEAQALQATKQGQHRAAAELRRCAQDIVLRGQKLAHAVGDHEAKASLAYVPGPRGRKGHTLPSFSPHLPAFAGPLGGR